MFRNPRVPDRVRREINVESGLNDGVATPVVTLFIGVVMAEGRRGEDVPIIPAIEELAIGIGIGVAVGVIGAFLMRLSESKELVAELVTPSRLSRSRYWPTEAQSPWGETASSRPSWAA